MTDLTALHDLLLGRGELNLRSVAALFSTAFDADGALLLLTDDGGKELRLGSAYPSIDGTTDAFRIPVGYGVTGLVALNGHAVTLVDDAPRNLVHRQLMRLQPDQTVTRMCVPARGLDSVIVGVVSVFRRSPTTPFTKAELRRAQRFADLVGLRIYASGLLGVAEEHHSQRDKLIAQAISAQEAERRRIAGDLHDGVTQALASLAFHLSAADSCLTNIQAPSSPVAQALEEIRSARQLAGLAYDETRAAISGLHSLLLDDLGLVAALESLAQTVPQLDVEFRAESAERIGDLPDHCAAALYRIAQEAINNAVKHAEAKHAVVSLRRVGAAVVLGITDDGIGFDVQSVRQRDDAGGAMEHFGLASIAERCALIGATLRVDSVEGRGTAVMVELLV